MHKADQAQASRFFTRGRAAHQFGLGCRSGKNGAQGRDIVNGRINIQRDSELKSVSMCIGSASESPMIRGIYVGIGRHIVTGPSKGLGLG